MSLIAGGRISRQLRARQTSPILSATPHPASGLLLAAGDAHGKGLVHRDIKPANVVVSRAGTTFDFANVPDFGLVKLDTARKSEDDAVTAGRRGSGAAGRQAVRSDRSSHGGTAGTPAFVAPEVVLGVADTDHRVDLYALGCVGY